MVSPSYNAIVSSPDLRQDMPRVTPAEIRAADTHSAQEPTVRASGTESSATQEWLDAALESRRNLRPSGRGKCQFRDLPNLFLAIRKI